MKFKFNLFLAVIGLITAISMRSCSKSNEELISDYQELCGKVEKAIKDGDMAKVASLSEEGQKLGEELDKRELTPEQQAKVLEITADLMKNSTVNIMENAQDLSSELEGLFE